MVGQCLLFALFFQKFIIFGGKSAWCGVKKWSDWNFFSPFLTFYRFTRTAQWYFVKGVDLKVPHTSGQSLRKVNVSSADPCILYTEAAEVRDPADVIPWRPGR